MPSAVRAALASFDDPLVRVPASLGLHDDIHDYLDAADIDYADVSDERWTAFTFEPGKVKAHNGPVAADEARILTAFTAWEMIDGELSSRTTLEQTALRSRLLAAMATAGRPGAVRWVPAYGPVEARISPAEPSSFATIKAVFTDVATCTEIETSDLGSVVLGLAIVAGIKPGT
jgi:hypothetical protein